MLRFLKFMKKKIIFDDGASVEWCDRETLKYAKGDHSCLIWVDFFDDSLWRSGRLIHEESIKNWTINGSTTLVPITDYERLDILDKVKKYYKIRGVKCRVES